MKEVLRKIKDKSMYVGIVGCKLFILQNNKIKYNQNCLYCKKGFVFVSGTLVYSSEILFRFLYFLSLE